MSVDSILIVIALICGLYMAWNIGANDVSNAMGTSVGSGALTLRQAILIAGVLEFCGAYFFGSHVSDTVQRGIVNPDLFLDSPRLLAYGMIASLMASGVWLQLATYYGWPVSTTHTIIGALIGFGAAIGGVDAVYWTKVGYISLSWVISPLMGGILSFIIFSLLRRRIFYQPNPAQAAKRLTPWMAFILITVLVGTLLSKGLKNIDLELSNIESLTMALSAGVIAAIIAKIAVNRIVVEDTTFEKHPPVDPKARIALEKAKKHLLRAQEASSNEMRRRIEKTVHRVDAISGMSRPVPDGPNSTEYQTVERIFGYLQIVTACFMAFAHGANDVANAIGPLSAAVAVLSTGIVSVKASIPAWILALGGAGIIVGLATWGWRVIETIGRKITELTPSRGFSAEFGAATTIVIASSLGMPVSTTHTLVGAVLGVGMARGIGALNLNTIRDIVSSWILTIPAGAIIAIGCFHCLRFVFGG
ncbi:Inorganic phosphate transporter 2-1, chloroplastic [Chlamydiales bacterium SCGC AG-110-P3]|nr:Inorganic phosphate transporter 2-1, chloroplastic [Chlamydiales bacterium SCGC AG-110-P3]